MEEALLKTKDKMMENLATLMERGEKIEALQAKTAELKVVSRNLKKKAQKQNGWCPGGFCSSGSSMSRGASDSAKVAKVAYQVDQITK